MTGYPWNSGDELDASDLNAAIAACAPAVALTNADLALTNAAAAQTAANTALDAANSAQTTASAASSVIATGGTVSSTIADRFGHILNLKTDFGAVGDNLTDDTAKVQAALAASAALRKPLYVPAGMYLITAQLNIASGLYLHGAGCYSTSSAGWGAPSTFRFAVNGTCVGTLDSALSTVTIEKMGFLGDYVTYPTQIGLSFDDAVRGQFQTCEITIRDCLFKWFGTGIYGGNKYQTLNIWNTACISNSVVGARLLSSDCYVFNLSCGNSGEGTHSALASTAQLVVGDFVTHPNASGYNTFVACQFYGGQRAVDIVGSFANTFVGCDIQFSTAELLAVGDGTLGCNNNSFHRCKFSGGNIGGGVANGAGLFVADVIVQNHALNNSFVNCLFADNAGQTTRTAAAINVNNPSVALGCMGLLVDGCSFNMDNITTPGGTDYAVLTQAGTDYTAIRFANCQKVSGLAGRLSLGTTFTVVDNNGHTLCS